MSWRRSAIKAPVTAADWTNGEFYSGGNAPTGSRTV